MRGGDGRVSLKRGFLNARGPVGIGLEVELEDVLVWGGRGDASGGVVESLRTDLFED